MILIKKLNSSAEKNSSRRVLAMCGDTQVGLWMLRSLARRGLAVYALCNSPEGQAAHSRYCAGAWMPDRSPGAAPLIEQVEKLARELGVGSVMPISESYHDMFIQARERFEPEIHVFSPPAEAYAQATDKHLVHQLCLKLGIPVARGTTLDQILNKQNGLNYPLVLRTRRQNLPAAALPPWKAAYARTPEELATLTRGFEGHADNILVQEYHPGVEDHVQVLMHKGTAIASGEYEGEHHMPLAGGVTVRRVSCRHEDLTRDAVKLLQALNWEGVAGVQYHYDPATGKYIFLEINPRFIGGLPTVIMAGFEAPYLLWQSHFEPERMRPVKYRLGLRSRILGGDANWMFGMIRGDQLPPGQERLSKLGAISSFLGHFGPWTRDDCFMVRDAKPFFVDFRQMLRRLRSETYDIIGNPRSQENPR